jgi:hypothetical protein
MSEWRDLPPPTPSGNAARDPTDLEKFKAKWTWVGWQILKWIPLVLIAVAISNSDGPAAAAAFLGLVLLVAWAYSQQKVIDLLYWTAVVIFLAVAAALAFSIWDNAGEAAINFWPEILGSLFVPMILTLAGRKKPRWMKLAIIASLALIVVGLAQINSITMRRADLISNQTR